MSYYIFCISPTEQIQNLQHDTGHEPTILTQILRHRFEHVPVKQNHALGANQPGIFKILSSLDPKLDKI